MKNQISYFAMLFILLFAFIGFIFIVFELEGAMFMFELLLLLALVFFLAFGMVMVYNDKSAGWGVVAIALALLLLDVLAVFLISKSFGLKYITTTFFAIVGFLVALANLIVSSAKEPSSEMLYEKKRYYYPLTEKADDEAKGELGKEQKVSATFTPGKYVASRKGGAFHIAKCDWALKISRENMVWFDSREEAEAKGFSGHKCLV